MKGKRMAFIVVAVLLAALLIPWAVRAAGGFMVSSWVVAGGGGAALGGDYHLTGTIGQPEAGVMRGGEYTLSSGFWKDSGSSGGNGGSRPQLPWRLQPTPVRGHSGGSTQP